MKVNNCGNKKLCIIVNLMVVIVYMINCCCRWLNKWFNFDFDIYLFFI